MRPFFLKLSIWSWCFAVRHMKTIKNVPCLISQSAMLACSSWSKVNTVCKTQADVLFMPSLNEYCFFFILYFILFTSYLTDLIFWWIYSSLNPDIKSFLINHFINFLFPLFPQWDYVCINIAFSVSVRVKVFHKRCFNVAFRWLIYSDRFFSM